MRFSIHQGFTSSWRTTAQCNTPEEYSTAIASSASAVFTSLILSMKLPLLQALFCTSQPFSGLQSIAILRPHNTRMIHMYCGNPLFYKNLPCPYHLDIDSSSYITSDGIKYVNRCSLKRCTKSSTTGHRYYSLDLF